MWPFGKKQSSLNPSFDVGNRPIILTDEEMVEIKLEFSNLKTSEGEYYVKEEIAEAFKYQLIATGLINYAEGQLFSLRMFGEMPDDNRFDNAISAIKKAFQFSAIPFFIFDLARYTEIRGNIGDSQFFYKHFVDLQENFSPTKLQQIYLEVHGIDAIQALAIAKERIILS